MLKVFKMRDHRNIPRLRCSKINLKKIYPQTKTTKILNTWGESNL